MLPCKGLPAFVLACAILLSPSMVAGQNADSPQSNNPSVASPILRRVQVRYEGSFDHAVCQSVYAELEQRGLLPKVESRYDQQKVDSVKKALQETWTERGCCVAR